MQIPQYLSVIDRLINHPQSFSVIKTLPNVTTLTARLHNNPSVVTFYFNICSFFSPLSPFFKHIGITTFVTLLVPKCKWNAISAVCNDSSFSVYFYITQMKPPRQQGGVIPQCFMLSASFRFGRKSYLVCTLASPVLIAYNGLLTYWRGVCSQ